MRYDIINTLGLIIVALLTAWNKKAIGDVHIQLNSRLSQLVEAVTVSSHAAGREEGRAEGETKAKAVAEGVRQGESAAKS